MIGDGEALLERGSQHATQSRDAAGCQLPVGGQTSSGLRAAHFFVLDSLSPLAPILWDSAYSRVLLFCASERLQRGKVGLFFTFVEITFNNPSV